MIVIYCIVFAVAAWYALAFWCEILGPAIDEAVFMRFEAWRAYRRRLSTERARHKIIARRDRFS